jgi:hypothetical protein
LNPPPPPKKIPGYATECDHTSDTAIPHTFVLWKELPLISSYFDGNVKEVANDIIHLFGKFVFIVKRGDFRKRRWCRVEFLS